MIVVFPTTVSRRFGDPINVEEVEWFDDPFSPKVIGPIVPPESLTVPTSPSSGP